MVDAPASSRIGVTLLLIALDFTATTRCKRLTPPSSSLCVRYLRLSGTKTIPSTMSMFSEKSMVARRLTVVPDGVSRGHLGVSHTNFYNTRLSVSACSTPAPQELT